MKTLFKSLTILVCSALLLAPVSLRAQDDSGAPDDSDNNQDASFQTFYDQLGDQGTWIQTDDYGYVFQPNVTDPNWQPYSDGGWVDTDDGFTWVSDEPWGWATYHYGRWANINGTGWVWVPGYRWAPAWVSWRYGGGYCGWAPLPPESLYGAEYGEPGVQVGFGFHFGGDVDVNFHIGAGCYNFVRVEDMGERNYRGHIINRYNNYGIINNTTNITNININNNRENSRGPRGFHGIAAGGPPINEVNAHARDHIQTVQLATTNQPGRSNLQGNTLAVFAPRVNPNTLHQARPGSVGQTLNHPTFNRGDSISKPLTVTRNIQAPPPNPEAIHAAEQAQASVPATAKIATPHTAMRTMPHQSFNSLSPVVHSNTGTPQPFNQGQVPAFHPQTQGNPNVIHNNPPETFHPQVQTESQGNPNVIHNNPPETFHPQVQTESQGNPNVIHNNPPPETFHREEHHDNGENQSPSPAAPTPVAPSVHLENPSNNGGAHPQNQSGGNGGGQNHPSGGGGQNGGHPSSGGQGGNHPSGGGGQGDGGHPSSGSGNNDKKP